MSEDSRSAPVRWRLTLVTVVLALLLPIFAMSVARWAALEAEAWLSEGQGGMGAVDLVIAQGQGARSVAAMLQEAGLIDSADAFVVYLHVVGAAGKLQAGEYRILRSASPRAVSEQLIAGRVLLRGVTVPEGFNLQETARRLAEQGPWTEAALLAAFSDPALARAFDPLATDLEGYLFPETYFFDRQASAQDVARSMVERFTEVMERIRRQAEGASPDLSLRELVTLASLVEKETAIPDEHGLVSSVFHNRLARGMRMQCDPTVIRALELDGLWTGGPLQRSQLKHPSPYNTYVSFGLPPGPICNVGEAALKGALSPEDTSFIFFVATGDGGHAFAETEREHRRNVGAWRKVQRAARKDRARRKAANED